MGMSRCDINVARLHLFVALCFDDARRTERIQASSKGRREGFGHMLNNQDGRAVGRYAEEKILDRFSSAGRGTHKDYFTVAPRGRFQLHRRFHSRQGSGSNGRPPQTSAFGSANFFDKFFRIVFHAPSTIGTRFANEIDGPQLQRPQRGIRAGLGEG